MPESGANQKTIIKVQPKQYNRHPNIVQIDRNKSSVQAVIGNMFFKSCCISIKYRIVLLVIQVCPFLCSNNVIALFVITTDNAKLYTGCLVVKYNAISYLDLGLVRLAPGRPGTVVVDLAGSTPLDPVVRLYRQVGSHPATLVFLGCASPVWNAQSSLEASVGRDETLLAQVGTSESREGRLVLRIERHSPPLG